MKTPNHFPFTNLVLEGGGVKGIAYAGALKVLEEKTSFHKLTKLLVHLLELFRQHLSACGTLQPKSKPL